MKRKTRNREQELMEEMEVFCVDVLLISSHPRRTKMKRLGREGLGKEE